MIFVHVYSMYLCRMVKVLFVCLGNICRSPLAEGLFLHKVQQAGLEGQFHIDSCGTGGWHIGNLPDPRSREVAGLHGITLPSRARKLDPSDFAEYDYILAMDRENKRDLEQARRQAPDGHAQILLMRDFDTQGKGEDVPDPYYGGTNGFHDVYDMLERSTTGLLLFIQNKN